MLEGLRVARISVAVLLIASVAISYTQVDPFKKTFSQVQTTSVYTSYSVWITRATTTSYTVTYVTSLLQTQTTGPYLKCDTLWTYHYDPNSNEITDIYVTRKITNLLNVRIIRGRIIGEMRDATKTETTLTSFWEIKPGETIEVKQGFNLQNRFKRDEAKFYTLRAEIECERYGSEIPVVYTLSMTVTSAYAVTTTYTQAYTQTYTPPAPVVGDNTTIFIAIIAACVIGGAIVMWLRKQKAQTPEPSKLGTTVRTPEPRVTRPEPAASAVAKSTKYCVHCGAMIPDVVTFCTKCGRKQ